MIHLRQAKYPFTHDYRIEVSATTETFRVCQRLPHFNPSRREAVGLFWGGHDGPGKELDFMRTFGNVVIRPEPEFVLDARRRKFDVDCGLLTRDHGGRPLSLAQVLAVCAEALQDPPLNAIFAHKLNRFFVQEPSGILRAVSALSTREYCILGVSEAERGSHHSENYLLTLV